METGARSGSFPADDGEIWAPIFFDHLDRGSSSTTPTQTEGKFDSAYEGDATMEIQQLLEGPRDEHDLDEWLDGAFSPAYTREANVTCKVQCEIYSPARDDGMTIQALGDSKINLLDCIPKSNWRRAPRGHRKRRIFSLGSTKETLLLYNHFVKPKCCENMPFARKGRNRGVRKNNKHWTAEEVTELVEGVSAYGVGRWTELKKDFFSTSVRTAVHLKDKWRNLLKACTVTFTSKKKGKEKKTRLLPLDRMLIERIRRLADDHPYPKSSGT